MDVEVRPRIAGDSRTKVSKSMVRGGSLLSSSQTGNFIANFRQGFDKVRARLGLLFSCRGFSMKASERPGMARVGRKLGVKLQP